MAEPAGMGLSLSSPEVDTLGVDELDAVMTLERSAGPYCWSKADWKSSLEQDLCYKLVADNELLAVAAFSVVCDEVSLLNIAVPAACQGRGYASHLLQHCLAAFAAQHLKHCFLEVRRSNTAALALYKKLGFASIGERKNYYPVAGGREDALVLLCQLQRKEQ
ncbi:ribosomal protein S18-alanine N-acetyltransferase [Litorivivens sp.]|uniref:ribosomal protein S18-alanine N-acetyltransferase n=1 Tax=Litorivivens sp. TaxID=2020868 RepID=UPI0035699C84